MTVVSAFLLPGNPLPFLRPDNPPWAPLAAAYEQARKALVASKPDVLLIYSTQWIAVLDQLWQTRPQLTGTHVDENWYEFGDLPMNIRTDVELAEACIEGTKGLGIHAKPVDYDGFPVDTGTIVAQSVLNADAEIPTVIAANNVYHSPDQTAQLAAMAVDKAASQGKRVAVLGVGGLSGAYFDNRIDIQDDRVCRPEDDARNRELLQLIESGDTEKLQAALPGYAKEAKADMGMKHLAWLLGAVGNYSGATTHGYGPSYGAGAAVVELHL